MDKSEFDVLTLLENERKKMTQREIAKRTFFSLGKVNNIIENLTNNKLVLNGIITKEGEKKLEPYRVKRAIFFAAGFGSRLVPITFTIPKPLVVVNGKAMLESLIELVIAVGIKDIIIVRGHMADKFNYLKEKYGNVKFIDNPYYNESNNISSAYIARTLLCKSYVFESDLVLNNKKLITKYQYNSNVLGFYSKHIDDWCLTIDSKGFVTGERFGGKNCYQMVGIHYIDENTGNKLIKDIAEVYDSPGGKDRYWEEVLYVYKKENYHVSLRECASNDAIEIDTYNELKNIDKSY